VPLLAIIGLILAIIGLSRLWGWAKIEPHLVLMDPELPARARAARTPQRLWSGLAMFAVGVILFLATAITSPSKSGCSTSGCDPSFHGTPVHLP
jgi:hypothetical protein